MKPNVLIKNLAVIICTTAVFCSPESLFAQKDLPLSGCVVKLIKEIDIPAQETGKLTAIMVKENEAIESNQQLAQIDDTRTKRMLELATLKKEMAQKRSDDPNELRSADAKARLTRKEYEKMRELAITGSETARNRDRARLNMEVAGYDFLAQKNAQTIYQMEVESEGVNVNAANDSIKRHKVIAPVSGHVLNIDKHAGEWVNAGETIMTVAPMDRLRIQTSIPARDYDPADVTGRNVTVVLKKARGRELQFKGKIERTGLKISGIDQPTFMIYAEIENQFANNQWQLLPGSSVLMTIHFDSNPNSVGKNVVPASNRK